ncbi:hypothetical protein ACT3UD_14520 [Glutamicibacter sp. 287]|nr:hypothetical protein CIK76_17755 [Glutamicibacter sp. BW80]
MAEFEEQHAWKVLSTAQRFDDSQVPSGISKAWLNEFGDHLDPAVSEQLRLHVGLLEERDIEYTAGRALLKERKEILSAKGYLTQHGSRFKTLSRELRCSNKRRDWLDAKLAAGDYDISDEDHSAYLKAVVGENAAHSSTCQTIRPTSSYLCSRHTGIMRSVHEHWDPSASKAAAPWHQPATPKGHTRSDGFQTLTA